MTNYMMTARKKSGEAFIPEPGPARYMAIAEGELDPSPAHVVSSAKQWFEDVAAKADARRNPNSISQTGDVLFYIHGFNVTQKLALARQVELEQNLIAEGWRGVVVGFDWPSDNKVLNYLEDRRDGVEVAHQLVNKGLVRMIEGRKSGCTTNIHILAHSAGAYVLTTAFVQALENGKMFKSDWRIGQVALVSGDISASSLRDGNPRTKPMFKRIMRLTNYQNPYDNVLAVSNAKRLGTSPRVGRVGLPDNPDNKAVNVNCGSYFATLDTDTLSETIDGNVPHAWYTANRVFCRDLAMTMEGAIDRWAIPTREKHGSELHLQDAPRPKFQNGWKMLPPIY
jgi:esterase/lipase superfamily enzyme